MFSLLHLFTLIYLFHYLAACGNQRIGTIFACSYERYRKVKLSVKPLVSVQVVFPARFLIIQDKPVPVNEDACVGVVKINACNLLSIRVVYTSRYGLPEVLSTTTAAYLSE